VGVESSRVHERRTLNSASQVRIRIAGLTIAVTGFSELWSWTDKERFEACLSDETPDVLVRVHVGPPPESVSVGDPVHSVVGLKNVYLTGPMWAFEFCPDDRDVYPQRPPQQTLVFDRSFTSGDLYVAVDPRSEQPTFSLSVFLSEVLAAMFHLHGGMMIHACGIGDGGRGMVFAGPSGAGKSTMAELWQRHGGAKVLNDDRLILRKSGGRWYAYPVPGVGRPQPAPSQGVAVEAMFLLSHRDENTAKPKGLSNAASSLLPHIALPTYDTLAIGTVLELVEELLKEVPLYELGFVPDESAVDFVRGVVSQGDGLKRAGADLPSVLG
jgi:hypothetical protein